MIEFDARRLNGLEWQQESAFGRRHQLKAGDSVLAELNFVKVLGTLAEARTASAAWTFKRRGAFTTVVGVRRLGEEREIATFTPNWAGTKGLLKLEGAGEFQLRSANFWASQWELADAEGQEFLRYQSQGILKSGARLELSERAKHHPQAALLVLLTWYVLLLFQMDGAAS